MADRFAVNQIGLSSPITKSETIAAASAGNEVNAADVSRAIYSATDQTVSIVLADDAIAISLAIKAGVIYPLRVKRVETATNLILLL